KGVNLSPFFGGQFVRYIHQNCDTAVHYFTVKADQRTWRGTTFTVILRGYAPDWILQDTCSATDTLRLCDKAEYQRYEYINPCQEKMELMADYLAQKRYTEYIDSVRYDFERRYRLKCLEAVGNETFTMTRDLHEYHYTLYYYDQAGNLVQTVPPKGVDVITNSSTLSTIQSYRASGSNEYFPSHTFNSLFECNSLNQVVTQSTPDAGETNFWHDNLGRVVMSEDQEQQDKGDYSYILFDDKGRPYEMGKLTTHEQMTWQIAFNPNDLHDFIDSAWIRREVIRTYYDTTAFDVNYLAFNQNNLRNLVSSFTYEDIQDNVDSTYLYAIHLNYDLDGNISQVLKEDRNLREINHHYKILEYEYDLVSGNVNYFYYQKEQIDQYTQCYKFDKSNRLTDVYSSSDLVHWDRDANYSYYLHGPLKREEIGELKVQGVDYAYTLQGRIKGVNSNTLSENRDIGQDGVLSGVNQTFARDMFGYSLGFYNGDYQAIGDANSTISSADHFLLDVNNSDFYDGAKDLYNGNIRHMVTAIRPFMGSSGEPQGMAYSYDQLNRLVSADAWNSADSANNIWDNSSTVAISSYHTEYSYDPNGNILSLLRTGASSVNLNMDDLSYNYISGTNQLEYVDDVVTSGNYSEDLDDQSSWNYQYDEVGNLIHDESEEIELIEWNNRGKVRKIVRTGSTTPMNKLMYSDLTVSGEVNYMNNTLHRHGGDGWNNGTAVSDNYLYGDGYIEWEVSGSTMHHKKVKVGLAYSNVAHSAIDYMWLYDLYDGVRAKNGGTLLHYTGDYTGTTILLRIERKADSIYWYRNGRLVTKMQETSPGSPLLIDIHMYYNNNEIKEPRVYGFSQTTGGTVSTKPDLEFEYGPDGHKIVKRVINKNGSGVITDTTVTYYIRDIQGNILATYEMNKDTFRLESQVVYGNKRIGYREVDSILSIAGNIVNPVFGSDEHEHKRGKKRYEFSNHLGNVLIVLSDKRTLICNGPEEYYSAELITAQDYYPFGMIMPGRSMTNSPNGYSFGFNGKEKMQSINDQGDVLDFGARIYNSSLGKFLSVDPQLNDWTANSPYSFAANSPVFCIDFNGEAPLPMPDVVPWALMVKNAALAAGVEFTFQVVDQYMINPSMSFDQAIASVDYSDVAVEAGLGALNVFDFTGSKYVKQFSKLFKGKYREYSLYAVQQGIDVIESAVNDAAKDILNGDEVDVWGIISNAIGEELTTEILNASISKATDRAMKRSRKKYNKHLDKAVSATSESSSLKKQLDKTKSKKKRKKLKRQLKRANKKVDKYTNKANKTLYKTYVKINGNEYSQALYNRAKGVTANEINKRLTNIIVGEVEGGDVGHK
ncbi:hypothetical protein GYB22_13075, partial [bacterium]|nr:hypothetical protein [bacterium]